MQEVAFAPFYFLAVICAALLFWRSLHHRSSTRLSRTARLSWLVPVAGLITTFLLAAGMSASNANIRSEVEVAGLAIMASIAAIGLLFTALTYRRIGRTMVPALIVNIMLCALVAALAYAASSEKRVPRALPIAGKSDPRLNGIRPMPVWIDMDPSCGASETADVDDCWALLATLRSPELHVLGISTTFGNRPAFGRHTREQAVALVNAILSRNRGQAVGSQPSVYPGAESAGSGQDTPASIALARALAQTPLTVLALGPLTNIAALIRGRPNLARRMQRVVLVAGRRPGQLFHPGAHWWFHFPDLNVSSDIQAVRSVLYSGLPVTLIPFELARKITITADDLERLRQGDSASVWLAQQSEAWLSFWKSRLMDRRGFHPFDALAAGYLALPDLFQCKPTRARIGSSVFLEPFGIGRDVEAADDLEGVPVTYCYDIAPRFKEMLLTRLTSGRASDARAARQQ